MHKLLLSLSILSWSFFHLAQGDDCQTVTVVPSALNYCSGNAFYTNVGSTPGSYSLPACWTGTATEDVWFQFTALGTDVLISVSGIGGGGTLGQPRIALYDGICGGTLNELNCANGTPGMGTTQLYEGALVPGNTYFVRVSSPPANEGSFELCINSYTPNTNPGADCGGAAFLCNQNPVSVATLGGGGANNDEPEPGTCLDMPGPDESNSSWFYWTCATGGPLTFDITPVNPNDDIDFIFYQLNSNDPCGSRTPVRCCSSSCLNATGSTGMSLAEIDLTEWPGCQAGYNAYIQNIVMTPGTSYAMLVNNFSANTGFTITFNNNNPNGGTFAGPIPNITSSNLNICLGDSIVFDALSSQFCSSYTWNFTQNGNPSSATGVGTHTVTYSNGGNFIAILNGFDNTGCQSMDFVNITVNPPIQVNIAPFDTICSGANFFQNITSQPSGAVFNYTASSNPNITGASAGAGGNINQILNNSSSSNQSVLYTVSGALNGCSDDDSCWVTIVPLTVPSFSQMGPYCLGLIPAPVLPNTSNNATTINGTWNPLAVNTQQLGFSNYNFTPFPNQCADTTSMLVEISTNPGVNFFADTTIGCSPLQVDLSTPVINGATYIWLSNGQLIGNTPSLPYTFTTPGCYDIELQLDVSGCSATMVIPDFICVENDPLAGFVFSPTEFTSASEIVNFQNTSVGANGYIWNYGDGSTSNSMEEAHLYNNCNSGFTITLYASSLHGCLDSISQSITYQEPLIYYVPNTFTPDQDEFNQQWLPIFTSGFEPYDYHLSIYNRWGELIWETFNPYIGWDGTYGQKTEVQEGTYTWTIIYKPKANQERKELSGTLNLIK